jgi:hypothetical protein
MPWTRKEVEFLESSDSPLTPAQKAKMNRELHADPALGHERKGHFHIDRGHANVRNPKNHASKLRSS